MIFPLGTFNHTWDIHVQHKQIKTILFMSRKAQSMVWSGDNITIKRH